LMPVYTAATDCLACNLHKAPAPDLCRFDGRTGWTRRGADGVVDWYGPRQRNAAQRFTACFTPIAPHIGQRSPRDHYLRRISRRKPVVGFPERSGFWPAVAAAGFPGCTAKGHPAYDSGVDPARPARRDVAPAVEAEMIAHYNPSTAGRTAQRYRTTYCSGLG